MLLQQYASPVQTEVAQGSHPLVSAVPVAHGECEHVSLPELVDVVLVANVLVVADVVLVVAGPAPVVLPDILLPQGFVTGTQTLTAAPSVVLTGEHAVPAGHAWPLVQSEAQYVSPANCAQSEPDPQAVVVTQGVHCPELPLELAVLAPAVPVAPPAPEALSPPPVAHEAAAPAQRLAQKKRAKRATGVQNFMAVHARVMDLKLQGQGHRRDGA